jgi:beta-glucanase (GH16 family)
VQVTAKMPSGSGLWPGLWMLPSTATQSVDTYEIDLFESGADSGDPAGSLNDLYSLAPAHSSRNVGSNTNSHVDLSASFNTYGLKWIPDQSITWYLDGKVIGEVTIAQATIPDEPMELIVNLPVANANAGRHSSCNSTTPTMNE